MKDRIATGSKVEIIDETHPHFGEIGVVWEIKPMSLTMLNKPEESGEYQIIVVNLKRLNKTVEFSSRHKSIMSQIKII